MENIDKIISELSLDEKISFCTGADMWNTKSLEKYGVGSVTMSDGPHGLRFQKNGNTTTGINDSSPATCFPTAVTSGASWDEDLMFEKGAAIGREALSEGVSVVLGPGCNIKRNAKCGRNFEYFSEDPYISGRLAAAFIKGLQSTGALACIKHFAANNQEHKRMNGDSIVDERALREIYLSAFEYAVKEAKPACVMASYNKINGVHATDNKKLLTDILRDEWGFDGAVITDWGAMNDAVEGFFAGCDLNMPGGGTYMQKEVFDAVKSGRLDEKYIDNSVRRILKLYEKSAAAKGKYKTDYDTHHDAALKTAEEGAVLLKNNGVLPLSLDDAALIGFKHEKTRHQGAGSSHINPVKLINIRDAIPDTPYFACCDEHGNVTEHALKKAAELAAGCKVAVVAAGLPESYESEAFDRQNLSLPDGMNKMVLAVAEANPNTVVVLLGGGVMELPWADKVAAILYMGLPGQAGGEAVRRLLTGEVNPSGKLTETWIKSDSDAVSGDTFGQKNVQYRESVYVGYRYYETANVPVAFPFGHGLSYTEFEYSDIKTDGNKVTAKIKNVGNYDGAEVVQLYTGAENSKIYRPAKELKGFKKVFLKQGEEKEVEFILDGRSFAIWHNGWAVPCGTYKIMLGSSVRDIRLTASVKIDGEDIKTPEHLRGTFYDKPAGKPTEEDFVLLYGELPDDKEPQKGEYTMDSTCLEMKDKSLVMKMQYALTRSLTSKVTGIKKDENDPAYKMMVSSAVDCPMRAIVIHGAGRLKEGFVRGLLDMANGRYFRGVKQMARKQKKKK